jgi:hypothetical protein
VVAQDVEGSRRLSQRFAAKVVLTTNTFSGNLP